MTRTFLITGASSGIGAQFARAYAARGADLVLVARRLDRLKALAEDLGTAHGVKVTCLDADLGRREEVHRLIERVHDHKLHIDGLINNAGYSIARTFAATTAVHQLDFVEVCVSTPTHLAHAFLAPMLAQGHGRIINVSSMVAFSPGASGHTLYPAAKAYMLKFSRSLAAEVAARGVKVTALCPGSTESEFMTSNGMADKLGDTGGHGPGRFQMTAERVVDIAIRANEKGREVVIPGFANAFAVALMTYVPDGLITPLIRWGAAKYQI